MTNMVGYMDISRFGGPDYNALGITPTPAVMGMPMNYGGIGASNPIGAYHQSAAAASPSSSTSLSSVSSPRVNIPTAGVNNNAATRAGTGLGWNLGTGELILGGLQTIGSLWQAWEANKLAKQQFAFQKDFANTNLANQIKSYNTTLEDRSRSRAHTEGQSAEVAQAYIDKNRLPDRQV